MDLNKAYALFALLFIVSILRQGFCSLQTTSGKVIDCVDIFKQPALDHPLLKDHKIQGDGSTGCYDIRCPGFIQTDKGIVLGDVFNRTSDYGGIQQQVDVRITQDPTTKNWILSFGIGNEERQAGYWPKELFPQMAGRN
ncbi:hypothetical protein MLD38_009317 [Melastoma candidum]|uniref:Uncharacterized protein n=1 Tax=Melastoma candidum TaxID=119954 RepID=A0ACB9RXC0_9MYRT|nr:hypothetical protein MLD38_009317 [Melastoma candidum]